jgi:phenylacetate-CoA ligase
MAEEATEMGLDSAKSNWEIGVYGDEPWVELVRNIIEKVRNILATDVYGLSDIIGLRVTQECTYKNGLHVFSDVFNRK